MEVISFSNINFFLDFARMCIPCLHCRGWLSFFVFIKQTFGEEYSRDLEKLCPFDFILLLILKNEIEMFHVSLTQWRQWTHLPCLIMKSQCWCAYWLVKWSFCGLCFPWILCKGWWKTVDVGKVRKRNIITGVHLEKPQRNLCKFLFTLWVSEC